MRRFSICLSLAMPAACAVALAAGPRTFSINGCVSLFNDDCRSNEIGWVTLQPLGRVLEVSNGRFSFHNVPPGDYVLDYRPSCNGVGCTKRLKVRIVDHSVQVTLRRFPDDSDCDGDCNGDGLVTVDEIVSAVAAAIDGGDEHRCQAADRDLSGGVTVDEIVAGITAALLGCIAPPTPLPTELPALPDLAFSYLLPPSSNFSCADDVLSPPRLVVCVANRGAASTGTFEVVAGRHLGWQAISLDAGNEVCFSSALTDSAAVTIDPDNAIVEADESNNVRFVLMPTVTRGPGCTPTPTPPRSSSPPPSSFTPTPTSGCIAGLDPDHPRQFCDSLFRQLGRYHDCTGPEPGQRCFGVVASHDCCWSVETDGYLQIIGDDAGCGRRKVCYDFPSNFSPLPVSAEIQVEGRPFLIQQGRRYTATVPPSPTPTRPPVGDMRPDLVVRTKFVSCLGGCAPHILTVCAANDGDAPAGPFAVSVDGDEVARIAELAAGASDCFDVRYGHFTWVSSGVRDVIWLDSGQQVIEHDEENNTSSMFRPDQLSCDIVCSDTPTPIPTPPRPLPSFTPTPTRTPWPTVGVPIAYLNGMVAETLPDGCSLPISRATVELRGWNDELYSTTSAGNGAFRFLVPTEYYRVHYTHPDYHAGELDLVKVDQVYRQLLDLRLIPLQARPVVNDPTTGFGGAVYRGTQRISGARVKFEREIDGSVYEAITDGDGRYLVMLPRGRYSFSASHPSAGVDPRNSFAVLCESGLHIVNFSLYHPPTPTPTYNPNRTYCGDGQVEGTEQCEPNRTLCLGHCGKRFCADSDCQLDCQCPPIELGGDACCGAVFHGPGCGSESCQACVCAADPFCCSAEWDPRCGARARQACVDSCACS
ncbi:MAG TPA: hypothetical protein VEB21_01910 [Terriglobales bacterium]|nr:hypothetical protein [Terriglobales bacterium]